MLYSHSISLVGKRPAPRGGTTHPDERKITTILTYLQILSASCCAMGPPVSQWHSPFLTYIAISEVNLFFKGGVARKHALVFCHFPYLTMIAFNCICGINHTAYIRCELEVFSKFSLFSCHDLMTIGYFSPHFSFRLKYSVSAASLLTAPINPFQVFEEFLLMLTTDIFNGVPYLVDDTKLYYCVRKNTLDGIREAFQTINASNKDIMNSTVLQIRQYV